MSKNLTTQGKKAINKTRTSKSIEFHFAIKINTANERLILLSKSLKFLVMTFILTFIKTLIIKILHRLITGSF